MRTVHTLICLLLVCLTAEGQGADAVRATPAAGIKWDGWSPEVFARAKKEQRFVLLDLEAVWCHWCHVMDEKTYANPEVIALMGSNYIAVRVDQDARPDLANRYEDYGWPATVVFNAEGGEIVKRRGYLPPEEMVSMLKAIIADPTPGPSVRARGKIHFAEAGALPADLRTELEKKFTDGYDPERGGWGGTHKFLDWDGVEYFLSKAQAGDDESRNRARQTLDAQCKLMDPVWGGVYQYSTDGDWEHPHFEKIMPMQAENMRIYAQAAGVLHERKYLLPAVSIHDYLRTFLTSPDGTFYTSQDADLVPGEHAGDYFKLNDAARRKPGVPRVDKHIYARENGLAINGLLCLYDATGTRDYLDEATRAARWILAHRSLGGGGFKHDRTDAAGPYLADSLYMARAFLHLYASTADRHWLKRAEETMHFMDRHFRSEGAGMATAELTGAGPYRPEPQVDENTVFARVANLLFHYTGNGEYQKLARHAMRYLAAPEVGRSRFPFVAGILLADQELGSDPVHVTVVGGKADPIAAALFAMALKFPAGYKQTEWWDGHEKALPNVPPFPQLPTAAAFLCADGSCSKPLARPEDLEKRLERLENARAGDNK